MKRRPAENGCVVPYADKEFGVRKGHGLVVVMPMNSPGGRSCPLQGADNRHFGHLRTKSQDEQ